MTLRRCRHRRPAEAPAVRRAAAAAVLACALLAACGSPRPAQNPAQQSASTLAQAGSRAWARGDAAQARALYERSLAAAESVEDFELGGAMLLNLALVQGAAGDLAGAQARVDRIIAAPQRYGSSLVAQASTRKALLYLDAPDAETALTWAERAQAACGSPCPLDATLGNVRAHVALQRGDAPGALRWSTLAAGRADDGSAERANAQRLSGRAQRELGQHDAAAAAYAQALAIDRQLGLSDRVALDLTGAAENEAARGNAASAREFYQRAIDVHQAAGRQQAADALRQRLSALQAQR
jgi:tetratricopeptide (TPR) repeat protein